MGHTKDEAREWVKENQEELNEGLGNNKDVPEFMKDPEGQFYHVWASGCWLREMLEEAGASDEEVVDIGEAHGQRSFMGNPYKWAVHYANEFEEKGQVSDKPGEELADKINDIHIRKVGDSVVIALEDPE